MNLSNPSEIRNAVVLVIDRLGANMLSAYGNTMFETENFNRLAARSIVFDHAIAPTTQLETAYKSFWSGRLKKKSLMEIAGAHGISSALLTDDEVIENHELSRSFDRVIPIRTNSSTKLGSSVEQTELAGFFAQATQWLSALEPGSLTWLHSRGLSELGMHLTNCVVGLPIPKIPTRQIFINRPRSCSIKVQMTLTNCLVTNRLAPRKS